MDVDASKFYRLLGGRKQLALASGADWDEEGALRKIFELGTCALVDA